MTPLSGPILGGGNLTVTGSGFVDYGACSRGASEKPCTTLFVILPSNGLFLAALPCSIHSSTKAVCSLPSNWGGSGNLNFRFTTTFDNSDLPFFTYTIYAPPTLPPVESPASPMTPSNTPPSSAPVDVASTSSKLTEALGPMLALVLILVVFL